MKRVLSLLLCLSIFVLTVPFSAMAAADPTTCQHGSAIWVTTTSPTATTDGVEKLICPLCETVLETRSIPADANACTHPSASWVTTTAPTATTEGIQKLICPDCYAVLDTRTVPPVIVECEHANAVWVTITPATTEAEGVEKLVCPDCETILDTRAIPKLGTVDPETCAHETTSWAVVTAPTCTLDGTGNQVCSACGKILGTITVPALGHNWDAGVVTVEPQDYETGLCTYTCSRCDLTRTEVIPALLAPEHTATLVVDGAVAGSETFLEGETALDLSVTVKAGESIAWDEYILGTEDITVTGTTQKAIGNLAATVAGLDINDGYYMVVYNGTDNVEVRLNATESAYLGISTNTTELQNALSTVMNALVETVFNEKITSIAFNGYEVFRWDDYSTSGLVALGNAISSGNADVFDMAALKEFALSLNPTFDNVASMGEDQIAKSFEVKFTAEGKADNVFGVDLGFYGDTALIKKAFTLLRDNITITRNGNAITVDVTIPQALADVFLKGLESESVTDAVKNNVIVSVSKDGTSLEAIFNAVTFDELLGYYDSLVTDDLLHSEELNRYFDFSGYTVASLREKLVASESKIMKIKSFVSTLLNKVPDTMMDNPVSDFYLGAGQYNAHKAFDVNFDYWLSQVSVSLLGATTTLDKLVGLGTVAFDLTVNVDVANINLVEYIIDGETALSGILPVGAQINDFVTAPADRGVMLFRGWGTDANNPASVVTDMPDADLTLYAVFTECEHEYTVETTPATCTVDGVNTYTCSICGYTYDEAIPALGHTLSDWQIILKPTTTTVGTRIRVCTVCGETVATEDIAPYTVPTFSTENQTTELADGSATFAVSLAGNPGLFATSFYIYYPEALSITAISAGDVFPAESFTCVSMNEAVTSAKAVAAFAAAGIDTTGLKITRVYFDANAIEDVLADGTIVNFTVSYTARGEFPIGFVAIDGDTINTDGYSFTPVLTGATLSVVCNHADTTTNDVAATCTVAGDYTVTCNICGDVVEHIDRPALGHTPGEWVITVYPTVESEGTRVKYCTVCGEIAETEQIAPYTVPVIAAADNTVELADGSTSIAVTLDSNPGLFATAFYIYYPEALTVTGVTAGDVFPAESFTCISINETVSSAKAIAAFAAAGVDTTGLKITRVYFDANEIADINANGTLVNLTMSYTERGEFPIGFVAIDGDTINANGYSFTPVLTAGALTVTCSHADTTINDVAATCTVAGDYTVTCNICGDVVEHIDRPALGHTPGEWVITVYPTVESEGTRVKYCTVCGEIAETEQIAPYTVPVIAAADNTVELADGSTSIAVTLDSNPGLFATAFYIYYPEALTVTGVTAGDVFPAESFTCISINETVSSAKAIAAFAAAGVDTTGLKITRVYFDANEIADINANGTLVNLTMSYTERGEFPIGFVAIDGDTINANGYSFTPVLTAGALTVTCSHADTTINDVAATCTVAGDYTVTCNTCGDVIEHQDRPALGHTESDWQITVYPTTTTEGTRVKVCTVCGETLTTEQIAPYTVPVLSAADQDVTTNTAFTVDVNLSANPGLFGIAFYVYYPEALTVTGITAGTVFPADSLTTVLNVYPTSAKAVAAFAAAGIDTTGLKVSRIYLDANAIEDIMGNGVIATLSFEGIANAGNYSYGFVAVDGEFINANGYTFMPVCDDAFVHIYNPCTHENTTTTTTATCTLAGVETVTCNDCGDIISTTDVPALGHDYQVTAVTAPTCLADGSRTYTCSRCGDSYTETLIPTGHNYEVISVVGGVPTWKCANCDDQYTTGDLNRDGKVNLLDILVLRRYEADSVKEDEIDMKAADINFDGAVNLIDVLVLRQFISAYIDTLYTIY